MNKLIILENKQRIIILMRSQRWCWLFIVLLLCPWLRIGWFNRYLYLS